MVSQAKDVELKTQADPRTPHRRRLKFRVSFCSSLCAYVPFFFFGNGILPQIVRDLLLINELTLLVASCIFTLYISELIIVASRIRFLPF